MKSRTYGCGFVLKFRTANDQKSIAARAHLCTNAEYQKRNGAEMKKPNRLLAAMGKYTEPEPATAEPERPGAEPHEKTTSKRAGQKHLGAYFDKGDPFLEGPAGPSAHIWTS